MEDVYSQQLEIMNNNTIYFPQLQGSKPEIFLILMLLVSFCENKRGNQEDINFWMVALLASCFSKTWCVSICSYHLLFSTVSSFSCRSKWGWEQLGQRSLHRGSWAGGLSTGHGEEGVWELRLPAGLPAHPLFGRGNRLGHGHTAHQ